MTPRAGSRVNDGRKIIYDRHTRLNGYKKKAYKKIAKDRKVIPDPIDDEPKLRLVLVRKSEGL